MNSKHWLWLAWLLLLSASANAVTPMISMGDQHGLALRNDGTVMAWGSDEFGQLGIGRATYSTSPHLVAGISSVKAVGAGQKHVLAVKQDGTVWAWGSNGAGQLGDGTNVDRAAPVQVGNVGNAAAAAGGWTHSVVLKKDGTVWAWGTNSRGELGDGTGRNAIIPVQTSGLAGIVSVAVGINHNIALRQDGTVWTWGWNRYGQIGDGTTTDRTQPVQVPGLNDVIAIGAGWWSGFALRRDGTVWEWGYVTSTGTNHVLPVQTPNLTGVIALSAGNYHAVAVKSDGTTWYWEAGAMPALLGNVDGLRSATFGHDFALLLKSDGSVSAFGYNELGELGDGTTTFRPTPVSVTPLSSIVALAAGDYHAVALGADGRVWTWGSDSNGQLARGSVLLQSIPMQVSGLTDVAILSAGSSHSLALKRDGTVVAWGYNRFGQLGDGSNTDHATPAAVSGLANVRAIATGLNYSLALNQDGTISAWGYNYDGQIGDGTNNYPTKPIQVPGMGGVNAIAASTHSIALRQDGTVWSWGRNDYGQLGLGTVTPLGGVSTAVNARPTQVTGLSNIRAIAAGFGVSFAVGFDGKVWGWGQGAGGLLGNGGSANSSTPIMINGLSNVIAISVGSYVSSGHALAYRSDGTILEWGINYSGPLGEGASASSTVPVPLVGMTNVAQISVGRFFSAFLHQDGTISTSGDNHLGQLGDGTLAHRLKSVLVSNETANGPLDLNPGVANNIPADKIPPFWSQVSKANEISTAITYNPEDLNKNGSVYVVAYLDPASPLLTGATPAVKSSTITTKGGTPLVAAVLTRSGWKQTSSTTPTEPLYSGTLTASTNTFSMYDAALFDQTKDNGLFCVSYAGSSTTSAKGLIRSVVSGVDASLNQCPPIQLGSTADTTAPSIPLNITAIAAGPGQVNLSWSAATDNVGVAHYNIYRGTSLIATVGNVTSYTDTSPQASTAYSYSVMACDIALNCSGQSTNAQTSTPAQPNVILSPGWNLVGNGGSTAMNVATLFGDTSKIYSLWKWVRSGNTPGISYPTWAMYAPGQADGGAAYAAAKGYEVLTSIQSAEGFWVNAKAAMSVPMTAPAWILSNTFQPNQSNALPTGWSLIATGEANTASSFNKAIGTTPPTPGQIPNNLTTLWAWENSTSRWYFYAPSLEAHGTLQGYVSDKGYLDFGSRTLTPTVGVWVNR